MFADDTNVTASARCINEVENALNSDLGAAHMSRASPASRADSILSRPMVA